MVSELWCSFFFDSREQVWVITNLSELDQNVFVVTCRGPLIDGTFLEKLSIDALLGFSDTHLDVHFNLGHKTLLYLSLDPSEHEGSQNFVEFFHHLSVFDFFFRVSEIFLSLTSKIKPFIKIIRRGENFREQEVQ
jgi:hypothetical protein